MALVPDRYGPLTIGRHPYIVTMEFSEPFNYAVGFEQAREPAAALNSVSEFGRNFDFVGGWEHTDPGYVRDITIPRTEYRFVNTDADGPLPPDHLRAAIAESAVVRYVVPLYTSEELGSAMFSLVPNSVVVSSSDLNVLDMGRFDGLAAGQGFFPLLYRDAVVGVRSRRIYSSLVTESAIEPPEEFVNYVGEPGAALWLVDEIAAVSVDGETDLVVEPDWYVSYPNDIGTAVTRPSNDEPTSDGSYS
jgi:hypothetical protein